MRSSAVDRWLAPTRHPDADLVLFCLPYAGGSAGAFRTWRDALPGTDVGLRLRYESAEAAR